MNSLAQYFLARAQERSTVAGAAAAIVAAFGFSVAPDTLVAGVNAVVTAAGLVAMFVPGGK